MERFFSPLRCLQGEGAGRGQATVLLEHEIYSTESDSEKRCGGRVYFLPHYSWFKLAGWNWPLQSKCCCQDLTVCVFLEALRWGTASTPSVRRDKMYINKNLPWTDSDVTPQQDLALWTILTLILLFIHVRWGPLPHLAAFNLSHSPSSPWLPHPLFPSGSWQHRDSTFLCASSTTYYDCSSPTQSHRNICAADERDLSKHKSSSVILIRHPALCCMDEFLCNVSFIIKNTT